MPLLYVHVTFCIPPLIVVHPMTVFFLMFFFSVTQGFIQPWGLEKNGSREFDLKDCHWLGIWGGMWNIDPSFIHGWCEFQHKRAGGMKIFIIVGSLSLSVDVTAIQVSKLT